MYFEGRQYPVDLVMLENTSMTLSEIDQLKANDPERYYRFFFFIQARLKKEQEEIDKIQNKQSGGSGESDTFVMTKKEEDIE